MHRIPKSWSVALLLAALCLAAGAAEAQLQSGNLFGRTLDDHGAALPGVSVTLSGQGAPQTQVTDSDGGFHFLGLAPGAYALKSELQGFSTVDYPNIVINVGRNTTIEVSLSQAIEDVITVTAESPLLDERSIRTGNTVSATELQKIPTARDPWAVLQSTPGVLTDRINVGGNESGQQSQYVGPGSGGDQSVWALDGVVMTDMSAVGSSAGYYDFDAFEEIQVTTGGSDSSIATGGVVVNMVTKRGTNEWRGAGRYYYTDDSLQSSLNFSRDELGKAGAWSNNRAQASFSQGNRVSKIEDYGLELGGPLVKDRLWLWGSYAKPKINLLTINNFSDKTTLEDYNAKLNWQIASQNALTAFAWNSNKVKLGRNAGPLRPQETTWDQGKFGPSPTAYKVEDTHIFSSSLYLTGLYSKVNGGFQLIPEGGDKAPFRDASRIWHNSFFLAQIGRPQEQLKADLSMFFNAGKATHELKFGAGHRTADQSTLSRTPGGFYELDMVLTGGPPNSGNQVSLSRDEQIGVNAKYDSAFVQDTLSSGNLTATVGLRYDRQGGENAAATAPANRYRPDLLPAVEYPGGPAGFTWTSITPRLGLTYALGSDKKTLLRASYAQFADQLASGYIAHLNPMGTQSYAYFYSVPSAGNGTLPAGLTGPAEAFSSNINPVTGALLQSNAVQSSLKAPITHELLFSAERALLPEFVVGVNLTFRRVTDILEQELLVFDGDANSPANLTQTGRVHRRSDYVVARTLSGTLPNGQTYSVPVYGLKSGVTTRGGVRLENGDREQDYKGISLVATKRLSNRWMLRGNFTYSDWTWRVPESENENPSLLPTNTRASVLVAPAPRNGEEVVQNSGTGSGSKGNVWVNSKWSYSLNGLYQVAPDRPWGFNVSAALNGRQGYPVEYLRNAGNLSGLGTAIQRVTDRADAFRLQDVHQLDTRIEKDFTLADFGFTVSAECFNVLNRSTVLQRAGVLNSSNGNFVTEIVSPRLFRLGLKFHYR